MITTDLERLVPLSPGGDATALFCVHASSGSAYSYLGLARLLGPDRPVYGIEAPGFDGDREPVRSLSELSAEYARTLREFQPDGDVLLLGWSLGGIIALDMARRLTEAGATVRQVVMVDVSVPRIAELPPEKEIARRFLGEILATVGPAPEAAEAAGATGTRAAADVLNAALDQLPADTSAEEAFRAAEDSGVLPAELDAELLEERYGVFRALVEASYGFEMTEQYHGPVTHLIASESVTADEPLPEHMRWDKVATDLTVLTVRGGHHSIWTGNSLENLAELIRAALGDAD